jgi:hypothetical protein
VEESKGRYNKVPSDDKTAFVITGKGGWPLELRTTKVIFKGL